MSRKQEPRPRTGLVEDATDEERAIGKRVVEFRDKAGLTNAALAKTLGVGEDTIKKITQGLTVRQWTKLLRLAEALGVTPNDVLGCQSRKTPNHVILQEALAATYAGLGLAPLEATELAKTVLLIFEAPQALQSIGDQRLSVRVQAELASLRYARGSGKG